MTAVVARTFVVVGGGTAAFDVGVGDKLVGSRSLSYNFFIGKFVGHPVGNEPGGVVADGVSLVLDDLFLEFLFRLRDFKSFVVGDLACVGTSNFFVIVACFVKDYVQAFFQFFNALVYCLFYDFLFCFFGGVVVATNQAYCHCESECKCRF